MLGIARRHVVTTSGCAPNHFGHQRLDQFATVAVGHQRRGAGPEQHRQPVVRNIPDQFLPARLMQVRHGLGIDAGGEEQPDTFLDNGPARRFISGTAVVANMHRAERLMDDHTRPLAMDADIAKPAEHMQRIREQLAQAVFNVQAILQQQHLGTRCGGLEDGRCQIGIAGGFRADQQPVAGRHVFGARIRLHRVQRQRAIGRAIDSQTALGHCGKFATQQKMHIEAGTRQHHSIETADCAGPDNADSRLGNCPAHGNSSAVRLSACATAALSSERVRRDFNGPWNSPSRTTNSAGK
ncbi:hypothetical protein D3C84_674090 [compost metagenome]